MSPFIYGLFDPQAPEQIRYIGMATIRECRPFEHAKLARRASPKRSHVRHWVQSLHLEGREYGVVILRSFPPQTDRKVVGAVERELIAQYRSDGHNLTNIAAGGEGGFATSHTAEYREAIRRRQTGRVVSQRERELLRASKMGNKHCVGRPCSPETRAKRSASVKAWANSPEGRAVNSEARKRYYQDPKNRAQLSASLKAAWARRKEADGLVSLFGD